ncbi:hypothetical protein IQ247_12650 [Plectonema cf. radiosum LEGE 06105]|uniref:Uncharacterized protein n=1 Tax=Plectonema cf. radiosum LEGE 06105 TaxID=945769 RepID=A0A8J7F0G9_9CYAN|nr:hypothetical protein [Plectonema radiosum]MBE9213508.1 hypothetical protein [Plectonema cf. radiosum LEGE 06105]
MINESASLQTVIEYVEALSAEEQDMLFELIKKRRIEKRREEIAASATETLQEWKLGKAKRGNFSDLKADLLDEE